MKPENMKRVEGLFALADQFEKRLAEVVCVTDADGAQGTDASYL